MNMITLAATKGRTPEQIKKVVEDGIKVIGESQVQEMKKKLAFLPKDLRVDFIGHLQTNKVKDVVKHCFLIHSVDSLYLAQEIDKQAKKIKKVQNILLEVNIANEPTKFGFIKQELINNFGKINKLPNIKIQGLMTMAPYSVNKENSRPFFRELKELKDLLSKKYQINLPELSMGMSNDYQVAVEEGATIIRLGRVIFEK